MADIPVSNTPLVSTPPTTEEGFLADRQQFWGTFTGLVTGVVIGLVVLLILMAVFLL